MIVEYKKIVQAIATSGVLFISINGCAHVGLSAIPQTREGYNQALSTSDNEQFLLNIVRMHFGQSPYFVNVDNMVTQSTLKAGSGVDSQIGNNSNLTNNNGLFWRGSPFVEFTQTPTITYSPLQGTQFVSGMLTPINLDNLLLLLQSDWSSRAIFKLAVDKVGVLSNAPSALHTSSNRVPNHGEFNNFVNILDTLEMNEKIDYAATMYKNQKAIVINISDDQSATVLARALHLSKAYHQIVLSRAVITGSGEQENILHIQTRSFFSMLNFLSKGVNSSDEEINEKNGVNAQISESGAYYNWNLLTTNLFLVSSSDEEPDNAAVKIRFDNDWYFIPKNDQASKATLILLRLIYSLQIGELKTSLPLITIPVK